MDPLLFLLDCTLKATILLALAAEPRGRSRTAQGRIAWIGAIVFGLSLVLLTYDNPQGTFA